MLSLQTPLHQLVGIGEKLVARFARLGIHTCEDLLLYFPRRHEDFGRLVAIRSASPGKPLSIKARVLEISARRSRRGLAIVEALLGDETGAIRAIWFGQPYLVRVLRKGSEAIFAGKVVLGPAGPILENPVFESTREAEGIHTGRLVPIYGETEGLNSRQIRRIVWRLLPLTRYFEEFLPKEVMSSQQLLDRQRALREIHFPESPELLAQARYRLAFEELFLLQLRLLQTRLKLQAEVAPMIPLDDDLLRRFVNSLPFPLTAAQRRVASEILRDLERPIPMNRLLEGDVGSGKTIVALLAALMVARAGYQTIWMAPTEILAQQHFETARHFLKLFRLSIGLVTSSKRVGETSDDLIFGTHALIQKGVRFPRPALIVVDEQHRFGVEQRKALRERGGLTSLPHFLSMTATPIPRTLALAVFGDLDLSVIDEMPPGRQPVETRIIRPAERLEAERFIARQIHQGFQVFVITPLIEESDKLQTKAAIKEFERLLHVFPNFRIGLLHGKLASRKKEMVMADFARGRLDILVATPVVEVGIDVPRATVMAIEGAERFGLASLHQFRGRVGRREHRSYCLLFTSEISDISWRRLAAFVRSEDGFALAEEDLKLRGPGELAGIRQHGLPDLRMANLADARLVAAARVEAERLVGQLNEPGVARALRNYLNHQHLE